MPFQPSPRPASMLASVLAAAGVMLAVTGCSGITPLGPDTPPRPTRAAGSPVTVVGAVRLLLASPFVLEAVTITAAGVSSLASFRLTRRYAHGYLTISIADRTWLLPSVRQPFTSPLQVALPSRNQTLQLHHLLVPSS
jgi:hypothetical protein